MTPERSRRAVLVGSACAALAGGEFAPQAARAEAQAQAFDIPAMDLGDTLRRFGKLSRTDMRFAPRLTAGQRCRALHGRLQPDGALRVLLADTDLTFRRTSDSVIVVTEPRAGAARHAVASPVDPGPIEELVVTAQKREQNLQDVPASVIAATAEGLKRGNVRNFEDLVKIVPSLTITKTTQPFNYSVNVRGVGTYAFSIAAEASVAVLVDDVPQPFSAQAFSALVDVERVEVLRGPQNTLFGKAASAGVIRITSEPVSDQPTARAQVTLTDDHEQRLEAAVSGPVGDTVRMRLSGAYSHYRGSLFNLTDGHRLNGQSDTTFRAKVLWTPGGDWQLTLSPYVTRTLSTCCALAEQFVSPGVTAGRNNFPQSVVLAGITPSRTNTRVRLDTPARANALAYGSSLRITKPLASGPTATSISSYDRYDLYDRQDTDSTDIDFSTVAPAAPRGGSANGGYFKVNSVTQELRFASARGGRFDYVAGLFFSQTRSQRYFVRGSNTLETYNGLTSLPTTNGTTYSQFLSRARSTNYAVFGQGDVALTDRLKLLAGLRLNHEDIRYTFFDLDHGVSYGDPACSTQSPTLPVETCDKDTALTGQAGLQAQVTLDVMAFATYARGYKGQAYDLSSTLTTRTPLASGVRAGVPTADAVAAQQPIAAETADDFELGLKSAFLDGRVALNVTAFHTVFRGFQAQSRDQITRQNVLNSVGKVTSKGVESEFAVRLGGGLSLNGAATYNKATLTDFPDAPCFSAQTAAQGCVGGVQDLSGKPLPNAPKWNLTTNLFYERPLTADLTGFASVGYRWQSKVIYSLLQDPDSVEGAYGLLSLSAGVRTASWRVTGLVNNVFDTHYALTRGRDVHWNINPSGAPPTDAYSWKPARDSGRYVGLRLEASY